MKYLACGDRKWGDFNLVRRILTKYTKQGDIQVEGECEGADLICKFVARFELGQVVKEYPAEWDKYKYLAVNGRKNPAGPIRNTQMLDENPDIELVIAFHPNIFESRGTKNMITQARKRHIKVILFDGHKEQVFSGPPHNSLSP